jgi:hypothetical protein
MSSSRTFASASASGPRTMPPGVEALFTSTSTRPKAARVASTRWDTDSELIVSATIGTMRRPVSWASALAVSSRGWRCRAQTATSTPSDASSRAIARPMPLLPPVTIATRPASPRSMGSLLGVAFASRRSVKTAAAIVEQADRAHRPGGPHLHRGGGPDHPGDLSAAGDSGLCPLPHSGATGCRRGGLPPCSERTPFAS